MGCWVRLTCEQEAIVEVDLDEDAPVEELRAAALERLDESGGGEWETYGADLESFVDRPLPYVERMEAEHLARVARRTIGSVDRAHRLETERARGESPG